MNHFSGRPMAKIITGAYAMSSFSPIVETDLERLGEEIDPTDRARDHRRAVGR
jgi:hypothetical protein